jgi:tripartite-type tricarboxylate transporter receptor subunit TctC
MGQNREGRRNPGAMTEGVGMTLQRAMVIVGLIAGLFAGGALARTGAYPARPMRIVVPSMPAGGLDVLMRILAPNLMEKWG